MIPSTRRVMNNPMSVLRDLDRVIGQAWNDVENGMGSSQTFGGGGFHVDIREEENELRVEAELPGFRKDEIDVNVEQGVLTIEASSKTEKSDEEKEGQVHLSERRTRHLSRRFTLPSTYDSNNIDASLQEGILTLKLPKREEVKPRKVEVK